MESVSRGGRDENSVDEEEISQFRHVADETFQNLSAWKMIEETCFLVRRSYASKNRSKAILRMPSAKSLAPLYRLVVTVVLPQMSGSGYVDPIKR